MWKFHAMFTLPFHRYQVEVTVETGREIGLGFPITKYRYFEVSNSAW